MEESYDSLDSLREAVNSHATQHGYYVARDSGTKTRVLFRCAKGRQPKSQSRERAENIHETKRRTKRRKTSTQMTGYLFRFVVK